MLRLEFEIDTNQVRQDIENLFYDMLSLINDRLPQNKVIGRIVVMQVPDSHDKTSVDGDNWTRDRSENPAISSRSRDIHMPHPRRDVDPNKMSGIRTRKVNGYARMSYLDFID